MPRLKLPKGITGFWGIDDLIPPVPTTNVKHFRKSCFDVARSLAGKIVDTKRLQQTSENFQFEIIEVQGERYALVVNSVFPLVTITEPYESWGLLVPAEAPRIVKAFDLIGKYQMVSRIEFLLPLSEIDLSQLADAELEQMKYWRPQSAGEIIFNCWD